MAAEWLYWLTNYFMPWRIVDKEDIETPGEAEGYVGFGITTDDLGRLYIVIDAGEDARVFPIGDVEARALARMILAVLNED